MSQKNLFTKLLRLLANSIENLEQDQIELLLAGKAKLVYTVNEKPKDEAPQSIDHTALLARLNDCQDRDQARLVLAELPNRDAVAAFARSQKIHVIKSDRREELEDKIIEFLIGRKLRTEAIQTLNMKGGSSAPRDDKASDVKDG